MSDSKMHLDSLRQKLNAVRNSIAALVTAKMPETVIAPLREQEAELARQINTEGGAYVEGDVKAGLFVGRDLNIEITPETPPTALLQLYYRALADECGRLPLGIIDKEFVRVGGEQTVTLPDVYVDLDVVSPPRQGNERQWALRLMRGEGSERTPLLEATTHDESKLVALLGDAGTGKTTFVNYLAYLLATDSPALPEPLRGKLFARLVLREIAARHIPADAPKGAAQMLWDGLRDDIASRLDELAANLLLPYLMKRLAGEGGFILLDGLDEVPEAGQRRRSLLQAIWELKAALPAGKTRLLVTARPYAYADKAWQLPGFNILALSPFSEEQVERFIERWYQAARPTMGWNEDTARAKGQRLREALAGRPYLANLASRPLLLTLMATLHSSWGQLPEDRAGLYEETVRLLLSGWQRAREVRNPQGELVIEPSITQTLNVGEDRIREALNRLAFTVHQRQRQEKDGQEAPADISEGEILVAFKPLLGNVAPEALLAYLNQRAGLIIARREGVYAFPHRSFQEYLAACHLTNQSEFAKKLCGLVRSDPRWWREVFLLGAGKAKQGGLSHAVEVVQALLPLSFEEAETVDDADWQAAALAGQALLELRLLEKAEDADYRNFIKRSRRWLTELVEGGRLSPRERADAGDVLGKLGDPRFDANLFFLPARYRNQPEPLAGFLEIPPGPFVMGSKKGDRGARDNEFGNDKPLKIEYPYWLARYPVTVAQFSLFVEAKGYEYEGWWTKTGRAWRRGEWDSTVKEDWLRDYLKGRPVELRGRPFRWEEQAPYPNRPVMGVSWFEAMAYCKWLEARLRAARSPLLRDGYRVRLLTEAEWEKAARYSPLSPSGRGAGGEGRRYPWGDEDWDENRANISASEINRPTTVGMYPNGATPTGLHDLSGSVWEWTYTLYKVYPYNPADGRNEPNADGSRGLRGGSWLDLAVSARCASRLAAAPDDFVNFLGFRVCVSLAFSEF